MMTKTVKRGLCALLSAALLVCCLPLGALAEEEAGVIHLNDAEDLVRLAENCRLDSCCLLYTSCLCRGIPAAATQLCDDKTRCFFMVKSFDDLISKVKECGKKTIAVAAAEDDAGVA